MKVFVGDDSKNFPNIFILSKETSIKTTSWTYRSNVKYPFLTTITLICVTNTGAILY